MLSSDFFEGRDIGNRQGFAQIVNATKKAYKTLSPKAQQAIDDWQNSMWSTGSLENAFKSRNELGKEIYAAFSPVRELIKSIYGPTVELYRGERNVSNRDTSRTLYSWTIDKSTPSQYTGRTQEKHKAKLYSNSEIKDILDTYNRTGFVSVGNYKFKRLKDEPEYFDIYKDNQHVTTDDDLFGFMQELNRERNEFNKRGEDSSTIYTEEIPVDKIIWVTHDKGSAEFIVAQSPIQK